MYIIFIFELIQMSIKLKKGEQLIAPENGKYYTEQECHTINLMCEYIKQEKIEAQTLQKVQTNKVIV